MVWDKELFISKRTCYDADFGEIYSEPIMILANVQPISGNTDIMQYGEKISKMQRGTMLKNIWQGYCVKFGISDLMGEGDLAYIDKKPTEIEDNADCANYKVVSVRKGFNVINVYFEKLQRGD